MVKITEYHHCNVVAISNSEGTETIEWTAIFASTDVSEAMQNFTSPSIYWEKYTSDRLCTYWYVQ